MIGIARMMHFWVLSLCVRDHELGRDDLRDHVQDEQDVGRVGLPEMRDPQEGSLVESLHRCLVAGPDSGPSPLIAA